VLKNNKVKMLKIVKYTVALATVPGVFGDADVTDSRGVGGVVVPLTATETMQYVTFRLVSLTRFSLQYH